LREALARAARDSMLDGEGVREEGSYRGDSWRRKGGGARTGLMLCRRKDRRSGLANGPGLVFCNSGR
jgi:hypothetical protein